MSKLRELIDAVNLTGTSNEYTHVQYRDARNRLKWYLLDKGDAIADLIEAANRLPKGSTSVNAKTPVADSALNDVAQCLSELEDDK